MNAPWEPAGGPLRATGGLVGVVVGEAWRPPLGPVGRSLERGTIASALLATSHRYVAQRAARLPTDVATAHAGVSGPGWLVSVALVRPEVPAIVADTLELATAAGVPRYVLGHCVTYIELASYLLAGWPTEEAIKAATGRSLATFSTPRLTGDAIVDALGAGAWALLRPEPFPKVMEDLRSRATPAVCAAAGGLLGLRGGIDVIPAHWHRGSRVSAECFALAPGLLRARYLRRHEARSAEVHR